MRIFSIAVSLCLPTLALAGCQSSDPHGASPPGIAGALYVLKEDAILRISVGGASDIKTKLEKSKTLAQKALARF